MSELACVCVCVCVCACRAMNVNYAGTGQAIASADRPMWVYSNLLADHPVAGQANVVFEHAYVRLLACMQTRRLSMTQLHVHAIGVIQQ